MTDEGEEPSEARYWAPDDAVRISCGMEIVKHKQDMARQAVTWSDGDLSFHLQAS